MYARKVGDRVLTFGVSGMLWENSLVMIDSETESLWSHMLGEAMRGDLKGTKLEVIPSVMTDWGTWKSRYPHTTAVVLATELKWYDRTLYEGEDSLLLGITDGVETHSWTFLDLKDQPVINAQFQGKPILVAFERTSHTPRIYDRAVDDRELTFEMSDDKLIDRETGSEWDWITGKAMNGPLQGRQLRALNGIVSLREPWNLYHPE